jgi:asparagine synthase (glutamine-hydrolysing)
MCGIMGIFAPSAAPPTREALTRMIASLSHRGPDEFGLYRDANNGLAHARLSIIDLKSGQQPLTNEDETVWLVFNGEIFNYVELRAELVELGHRFRTRSDTEVIVHAFEQWGGCGGQASTRVRFHRTSGGGHARPVRGFPFVGGVPPSDPR